jgi:hypothetical protein
MAEVAWKLDQLLILLEQIREIEVSLYEQFRGGEARFAQFVRMKDELESSNTPEAWRIATEMTEGSDPGPPALELGQRVALFVECFYYIAFRCGKLASQLPGLDKLRFQRIKIVRNQLIEHSDGKDMQLFSPSSGWGPINGVLLRSVRQNGETEDIPTKAST